MAYAEVAGLSPVNGLYALLLPTVAYALLGSSRQLVVGPEGSISALVGARCSAIAAAGSAEAAELAATLALLVAACFVVARLAAARLDRRLPLAAGADRLHPRRRRRAGDRPARASCSGSTSRRRTRCRSSWRSSASSATSSAATLAVGARRARGAAAAALPRAALPAALLVVVGGDRRPRAGSTSPTHGVAVVGAIPSGLPELAAAVAVDSRTSLHAPARRRSASSSSAFADEILTARSFAGKHGQHVDVGQELLAMGAAQRGGRPHAGLPGRRERLAHRRQRRDGRAQPDRRPARRRRSSRSSCSS